jgi:hypothetical protein
MWCWRTAKRKLWRHVSSIAFNEASSSDLEKSDCSTVVCPDSGASRSLYLLSRIAQLITIVLGQVTSVTDHADGSIWVKPSWNSNALQLCSAQGVQERAAGELQALLARSTRETLVVCYPSTAVATTCGAIPAQGGADAPGYLTNQ